MIADLPALTPADNRYGATFPWFQRSIAEESAWLPASSSVLTDAAKQQ